MTGSGTALDPWIIWDVNDLQAMANGAPYLANGWYELGDNIDAAATTGWNWNAGRGVFEGFEPRTFTGRFNGRYFAISSLYMDRWLAASIAVGLFGSAASATIQNLFLNVAITSYAQAWEAANNTGALVGYCGNNNISRIIATGTLRATSNDTNPGGAHGNCNAGGMFGQLYLGCVVNQCASYVNVIAIAQGDAVAYGGGFVGNMQTGVVSNCYAQGTVNDNVAAGFCGAKVGGTIDNCYSTGAVAGTGGFNGGGGGGITDSFWDINTSGWATSFGGTGRTTPVMKTQANYTAAGWDFVLIWAIDLTGFWNDGYPYFVWNLPPTIQVVSPNGGEVWLVGSTHTILWSHTKDPGANVRIELLLIGVLNAIIIASTPIGPMGGGSYDWTIDPGQAPSNLYRIRISSTTTPITDDSDNDFTIQRIIPAAIQVVTLPATEIR